ncbi:MAG: serine hydrolase [Lachnospiraceae bacterium]|nr:serine hydrolase [Lachnospiraceae bacterium]
MSIRKKTKGILGACLAAFVLSSAGCGQKTLERPYVWSQRNLTLSSQSEADGADTVLKGRALGFAEDLCVAAPDAVWEDSAVNAEAAAVFDLTDCQVIYGKNVFEQLHPASITKVMTAIVAIKYGNLEDLVTVTEDAVITERGASLCNIKPGDTLTLEQLLYGLMLPSGNDAAAAIAVHMAGSIDGFAELMNQEAARLGATSTHFTNPHGLTNAEHLTTAYDLYLIFNEALKLPKFREVTGTTAYTANYTNAAGEAVSKEWKGGNWYMTGERTTPDGLTVFGGKTGTTNAAGYCLIMASRDEKEKEYISVVLKAGSRPNLYDNMTEIIQKIVN